MLIKNDFASWKVFYAFSYFEITTINLSQSSTFKENNKTQFSNSSNNKTTKKAANIVFIVWYALLNTLHPSAHVLYLIYSMP